jgi:hypothetical protein
VKSYLRLLKYFDVGLQVHALLEQLKELLVAQFEQLHEHVGHLGGVSERCYPRH